MGDLMTIRRAIIASNIKKPAAKVYGVEWNYADPSTVLKRTGAAANFANPMPAESLNEVGWSPFDNVYPWSEMKRYNIINGEVAYSEDDAGYNETNYDTVVYIPEFYYYAYKDTTNHKWNWSISATAIPGYKKHPGSGRYVGRFHTSGDSTAVYSKSDVVPLASVTRANFRTYSHNKGEKWYQQDLATWSAIQMLYLIEFANWHSQNTLGAGQNSGSLKDTGATTSAQYHTIKRNGNSNSYRWIENLFSNLFTFIDGVVASGPIIYISTNNNNYGDTISEMENTGINLPSTDYITGIGYSNQCPWAFIPDSSSNGSASTYIPDFVISKSSNVCLVWSGGFYNSGDTYGLFYFGANLGDTSSPSTIGSRLLFIP